MEWLKTQIARYPKLAQMIGQALYSIGGFLIVAGLIARAGMLAINIGRGRASLPLFKGLVEAYPQYPLWFVPEGFIGYFFAAVVASLGIYVALTAKAMHKARRKR
jgi:hypothetical protein